MVTDRYRKATRNTVGRVLPLYTSTLLSDPLEVRVFLLDNSL
jgi:hypothetical protein